MEVDDETEKHTRGVCTPSVKGRQGMSNNEEDTTPSPRYKNVYMSARSKRKKFDHSDPLAIRDYVLGFDSPKYGSVTKDLEDLISRKRQMFMPLFRKFPALAADSVDLKPGKEISIANNNTKHDTNAQQVVVIIDSDDDEPICQIPSKAYQDSVVKIPLKPNEDTILKIPSKRYEDTELKNSSKPYEDKELKIPSKPYQDALLDKPTKQSIEQLSDGDYAQDQATKEGEDTVLTAVKPSVKKEKSLKDDDMDSRKKHDDVESKKKHNDGESKKKQDDVDNKKKHNDVESKNKHDNVDSEKKHGKGEYIGVEDDDADIQSEGDFDGLGNIWKEMTMGLDFSKDIFPPSHENTSEEGKDCDHTFILKEDIGSVCRVCGIIERSIESIIEFQRPKTSRSIRTYYYEPQTQKGGRADLVLNGLKLPGSDFKVSEVTAHPRHKKQMKPHQIEGFNFLLSNLVCCDKPGGCILAHAPGSGKTFMLISFIQSFMAKDPDARPLVILPRGILGTWKKEFIRWQVEDIPLLDLYSVKAEGRIQQLQVLKQWVNQRSILFLGYNQFSSIVCDDDTSSTAVSCQEILLTYPSLLILDEGHTPRNQDTNILTSLEKIQTPLKVVLSGTLYQNHVREVFNILNLVRPKFLRMESSKVIKRRILSRVPIESRKNLLKKSTDNEFYEVVEHTLQKDENFRRKVTVIEDLREMTSKVLHYYKGDSLDELPGLVDFSVFLNLTPKQKRHVTDLRKLGKKFKISSDGSAIYVHPALKSLLKNTKDKNDDKISKIDELLENLDEREGVKAKFYLNLLRLCESEGEKLLVFGQYLIPLRFLLRLTMKVKGWKLGKEIFMITGDHDNDEREIAMEQFNNSPDSRVFFGSIKACGEGISLVGASRIIILDIHLNPSVTRQAIGRAFRPGQVKKVYTYRLIAADSPEAEDHETCFKKESIAKMWFEWNEYCGHHDFEMETTSVEDCGDRFLETKLLNEDVTAVYKR